MLSPVYTALDSSPSVRTESFHPAVIQSLALLSEFHDSAERQIAELTCRGRVESPPFPLASETDAWYAMLGWLERTRRIWATAARELATAAEDTTGRTLETLYHDYCRRAEAEPSPSKYGWETAAEYVRSCAWSLREARYSDPRDLAPLP